MKRSILLIAGLVMVFSSFAQEAEDLTKKVENLRAWVQRIETDKQSLATMEAQKAQRSKKKAELEAALKTAQAEANQAEELRLTAVTLVRNMAKGTTLPTVALTNGTTLKQAVIESMTDSSISFNHSGGQLTATQPDLPKDLVERFALVVPTAAPPPVEKPISPAQKAAQELVTTTEAKLAELRAAVKRFESQTQGLSLQVKEHEHNAKEYRDRHAIATRDKLPSDWLSKAEAEEALVVRLKSGIASAHAEINRLDSQILPARDAAQKAIKALEEFIAKESEQK